MVMQIIEEPISISKLKEMAKNGFGEFVKAVVDVDLKIMAVDAELHADEEAFLLERGSKQTSLWGINIYPELKQEEQIEFDSMINLRPSQGNRTRTVENEEIRRSILDITSTLIKQ